MNFKNKKMNFNYLHNNIIPQREKEIKEGKNAATRQPIYVVLELQANVIEGHSDLFINTNYKGVEKVSGYVDDVLDTEDMEFCETDYRMKQPKEFTKFYTDRIIAFFLTSKGAHDYLKYQSHNLGDAYVYVFYSGYDNREMDNLLDNS